jgi:hypothetical protein
MTCPFRRAYALSALLGPAQPGKRSLLLSAVQSRHTGTIPEQSSVRFPCAGEVAEWEKIVYLDMLAAMRLTHHLCRPMVRCSLPCRTVSHPIVGMQVISLWMMQSSQSPQLGYELAARKFQSQLTVP